MKVTILLYGQLIDKVGKNEIEVEDVANTEELIAKLTANYPDITQINYKIAINQSIITSTSQLNEGDEIALLPPFAGG
ncbi:MAG: molybdopterin synthase sulfur carrier subunit [Bacteroidetes bacterium]|nr:MAG: molybdopterin synthase sulfur carrier subunit [Bacteroidota bacterium]